MKRSTILALAGAMTVFLTGCGGESTKPTPTVNQEAAPAAVEAKDKVEEKATTLGPRAEADTMVETPAADTPPEVPAEQPAPEAEAQTN